MMADVCGLSPEEFECVCCHELLFEPVVLPCGHCMCRECMTNFIRRSGRPRTSKKCPMCRRVIHTFSAPPVCRDFSRLLEAAFPHETAQRRGELASLCPETPAGPSGLAGAPIVGSGGAGRAPPPDQAYLLPFFVLEPLLPGQRISLHVFEFRYLVMIREAIQSTNQFGMLGSYPPLTGEAETGDQGYVYGVEVQIEESQELVGGRMNLTVVARRLVRIESSTMSDEGYLLSHVSAVDLQADDARFRGSLDPAESGARDQVVARHPSETAAGTPLPPSSRTQEHQEPEPSTAAITTTAMHSDTEVRDASPRPGETTAVATSDSSHGSGAATADDLLALARSVKAKVEVWEHLVVDGEHERHPGHLNMVKNELGPVPDAETDPSKLALWVAALINPLPGLGVTLEIRPLILNAQDARERLDVVDKALGKSMEHLERVNASFLHRAVRMLFRYVRPEVVFAFVILALATLADRVFRDRSQSQQQLAGVGAATAT